MMSADARELVIARAAELRAKAIVLDTETTGVAADDEVIELSIVRARDGEVLFDSRFKPSKKIEWGAMRVHGIKDYQLSKCQPFIAYYEQLVRILQSEVVMAWGASNDRRFLSQTFAKYGLLEPEIEWTCAMKLHQEFAGMAKPCKLEAACDALAVKAGDHSAVNDALAAARVIYKIAAYGDPKPSRKAEAQPMPESESMPNEDDAVDWDLPIEPGKPIEFFIPVLGVNESVFYANLKSQMWTGLNDQEREGVESLVIAARGQTEDLRFDQYGPRVWLSMNDDLYFDFLTFRRARFLRLNAMAKRKKFVEIQES